MIGYTALAAFGVIFVVGPAWSLYQDTGYPYESGALAVDTRIYTPDLMPLDTPPIHTKVYWPAEPDTYAVLYYITGFGGVNPAAIYDDVLSNITSHGYVVLCPWALIGDDGIATNYSTHFENLDWFMERLPEDLGDVIASFDDVTVGCHSAGCTPTLNMALERPEQIKALVNLEPVSTAIRDDQPEHVLPSLNLGAELANMSCSFPGRDFITWYNNLACPRIMLEAAGAGHCDLLDEAAWETCDTLGFCRTGDADRAVYRDFVSGLSSAFMTAYVQGNMDQLQYVTDPSLIPWDLLQHETDVECEV